MTEALLPDSPWFFVIVVLAAAILRVVPPRARVGVVAAISVAYVAALGRGSFLVLGSAVLVVLLSGTGWADKHRDPVTVGGLVVLGVAFLVANPWRLPDADRPLLVVQTLGAPYVVLQAAGHLIDRRRRLPTAEEVRPVDALASLAYFPHFLAGPVLRCSRFRTELRRPDFRPLSPQRLMEGGALVSMGFAKKEASDLVLSLPQLREVLLDPSSVGPVAVLVLAIVVVLASYLNIFGYIDIVRGASCAMGFDMPRHFAAPFTRSVSLGDFFRRWQTTLMSWFRDYVLRPLRGSAASGSPRRIVAVFVTFGVAGLWHRGLFVVWGLILGAWLGAETWIFDRRRAGGRPLPPVWVRRVFFVWVPFAFVPLVTFSFRLPRGRRWDLFSGPLTAGFDIRVVVAAVVMAVAVAAAEWLAIRRAEYWVSWRWGVLVGGAAIGAIVASGAARTVFGYVGR